MLLARSQARRAFLTARHELTADSSPARKCSIDPRSSRFALDNAGPDRAGLSGSGSEELLPGVAAGAQRPHPVLHGRSRCAGIPLAARRLQLLRPHLPGLPALTRARELLPARRRRGTMRSMVEGA